MANPVTRDEFATPNGRKRAWRELMISDHGFLRKVYNNTHEIAPEKMWRTYQPSPADLKNWRAKGVRTVINLRGDKPSGFYFLEEEACEKLGLDLVCFRVFSRDAPSPEILHGAKELFETIKYPAIMHCKSGADRAGLMATLYLFFHEGMPLDKALEQLSFKYGHVRQGKTGVIDYAFNLYMTYAKQHGKSLASAEDFLEWVDRDYDHVRVKADFKGTGFGNLLTEKILRRE